MTLEELKRKLTVCKVPERWYSLDGGLKPDAVIIYRNYSFWECFYLDEKGVRNMERVFTSDEDAYDCLWQMMERQLDTFRRQNRI